MLRDITLGQYYPVDSPIHRLDPRTKIVLTIVYIVAVFFGKGLLGYLPVLLFLLSVIHLSGVPFKMMAKSLRPLRILLIFTFVLNLFFVSGGEVLFKWQFIQVTKDGLSHAMRFSLRLIFLVLGTSLMTLTTPPVVLTDGLESLSSPLKKVGFPAHEMAMMMTIALRFIPTLIEETDKIMKAQSARGADFSSGSITSRAKAMIPLLVPLFISAFRRAGDLAFAMEARCYRGGEGRTRLHILKYRKADAFAAIITGLLIPVTIYAGRLL
jgi:energy-coupling factor transport system permease protein